MEERRLIRAAPIPALVLGLGRLGCEVLADVEGIYRRGDVRRAEVTCFLALLPEEGDGLKLAAAKEGLIAPASMGRREGFQRVVRSAARLGSQLRAAAQELRTQERLRRAGHVEMQAVPLVVLLVGDAAEPFASGALLPLLYMLQDLLSSEPYSDGQALVSVARLDAEQATSQRAAVYAFLQEFDALRGPNHGSTEKPLIEALRLDRPLGSPPWLYLFDQLKEGVTTVRDRSELRIVLANALLGMLSGGLASRLAARERRDLSERAYCGGIGATCVAFEPEVFIEGCATRQGSEFLVAEMPADAAPQARLAEEWAKEQGEQLGGEREWLERASYDTPIRVVAGQSGAHLALHFAPFDFAALRRQVWGEAIVNYDALFGRVYLSRLRERMQGNLKALEVEREEALRGAMQALPQRARLYSGGIATARRALEQLDQRLQERAEAMATGAQGLPVDEAEDLMVFEDAAWNFPDLPALGGRVGLVSVLVFYVLVAMGYGLKSQASFWPWLGWVLAILACLLILGGSYLWLHRHELRLLTLRQKCIANAERRYAAQLESETREALVRMCAKLRHEIGGWQGALNKLQENVNAARLLLSGRPLYAAQGLALFRPLALTEPVAEAIYAQQREVPEALLRPLLEEEYLLAGWWDLSTEALAERLLAYGRKAFAPLRELSVDDLFRRRSEKERRSIAQELDVGALPLLRASFDRLGGAERPSREAYVLCARPEASALIPCLDPSSTIWEYLPTGDPYSVAFLRVCSPLPLAAVQELLAQSGEAYWLLDKEARRELHLMDSWADLPDVGPVAELRRRA